MYFLYFLLSGVICWGLVGALWRHSRGPRKRAPSWSSRAVWRDFANQKCSISVTPKSGNNFLEIMAAAWLLPGCCLAAAWLLPGCCLAPACLLPGCCLAAAWLPSVPGCCLADAWQLPGCLLVPVSSTHLLLPTMLSIVLSVRH